MIVQSSACCKQHGPEADPCCSAALRAGWFKTRSPQSLQAAAALAAESEANKNVTGLIKFSGKAANSGRELQAAAAGTELVSLSQFSAWEVR